MCAAERESAREEGKTHILPDVFSCPNTTVFCRCHAPIVFFLTSFFPFFFSLLLILLGCFSDFFLPYQVAQASASWHKPSAWLPAQARQPADVRAVALSTKSASFSNSAPRLSVGLPGGCTVLLCQCLSVP